MPQFPVVQLKSWFAKEKRDFPWRITPSPYEVWVSEVMLQQTQASVVVSYFERWMARFPSIHALAESSLEEVMKLWEGLGYYARVRSLHSAAKDLVKSGRAELPSSAEELKKIRGIGPYTLGAILSFAFHKKAAAVDGNVMRTIARYFLVEDQIDTPQVRKKIEEMVLSLLPEDEPWIVMEALIELGATICGKKPLCFKCPIKKSCLAYQHKKTEDLPNRRKSVKITHLKRAALLIFHENEVLARKVEDKKVMAGLYEFPYLEEEAALNDPSAIEDLMQKKWKIRARFLHELPKVLHSFTRYRAELYPTVWRAVEKHVDAEYCWLPWKKLKELPFSSGHRRLIQNYENFTH